MPKSNFRNELETIINRNCMECGSDTPDFVLAQFLEDSLNVFDKAIIAREKFYGRYESTE